MSDISELVGKTIVNITRSVSDDELCFITQQYLPGKLETRTWRMYHSRDCCEDVHLEDVAGDLKDLLNEPVILAEMTSNDDTETPDLIKWTFYRIATKLGLVTLRWYGESNGYYSVDVDFEEIGKGG